MAHFLPPEHVRQVIKLEWPYLRITAGWNIGSKTLLAKRGKLPLKLTCPPALPLQLGSCSACLIAVFAEVTCTLQSGKWLCCTNAECLLCFRKNSLSEKSGCAWSRRSSRWCRSSRKTFSSANTSWKNSATDRRLRRWRERRNGFLHRSPG